MKKTPFLVIVGVILLIIVGAFSGYAYFQKSELETELQGVELTLANKQKDLLQLENQNVLQAINAKRTVGSITEGAVKWSEVIKKIRSTIPKKSGDFLVDVLTYSGSKNSDLSLTVKTIPGSDESYMDVADLIEAFDDSREFKETFVPSISAGTNEEGLDVLSFSMTTKYFEETVEEALENDSAEDVEDTPEVEEDPSSDEEVDTGISR